MTCKFCTESGVRDQYPFVDGKMLVAESHYGVSLGECRYCHQAALMYWVEVYENLHDSACAITQKDLKALCSAETSHATREIALQILRSQDVVCGSSSGFHWLPGKIARLDGPPW